MLANRLRLPALLAGALFATACGDDEVTRSQIPREFAKVTCDTIADCPRPGGLAVIRQLVLQSPKGTCEDAFARSNEVADIYDAQIEAGTIRYDSAAAKRCLDAIASSCGALDASTGVKACNDTFRGTVATGGACTLSEECADDGFCRPSAVGTCGGTCEPSVTLGQTCLSVQEYRGDDPNANCGSGAPDGSLECVPTEANDQPHCVLLRTTEVGNGQPCGDVDTDGDDQTFANCRRGSYCKIAEDAIVGVCAAMLATGTTCEEDVDVCADGLCTPPEAGGRCLAITVVNREDQACNEEAGTVCNPLLRLACVAGICQAVGNGGVGAGCRDDFDTDCDEGLYCSVEDGEDVGTCTTLIANGSACDPNAFNDGCASGYCTIGGAGLVCAADPGDCD